MESYPKTKNSSGLFVVLELRNRQTHSEVIENDRAVLISLAKLLNIKKICYEQLKNESDNRNVEDKKCNFNNFLSKVASHANDNSNEIDYLMLFVLAECENVESSIKFEFFDNNSGFRFDITLSEILRPFLANVCKGLKDKPKIVMIHASEKYRAQNIRKKNSENGYKLTPNHADFYICISRPREIRPDVKKELKGESKPSFLMLLYTILCNFPEYEINQVISVLQRETLKYNKEILALEEQLNANESSTDECSSEDEDAGNVDVKVNHSLRLWNSSRLRKELYLRH